MAIRAAAVEDRKSPAERAQEHAETIATVIVEQLEKGTAPWQRPWDESRGGLPRNAATGKAYRGSNALYLWALQIERGASDPRWLTYRQADMLGAQVRKGERGVHVVYPATHYEVVKKDAQGKPVIGADGQPEKVYVRYDTPRMKVYTVFHASQVDGLPPHVPERKHGWDQHERAEAILAASGAQIGHGGNSAYYVPLLDRIQLPDRTQFASPDRYYATALHELGHWTGHESRLARDLSGDYGTEKYAKEELRAEIASMMLGAELDLGHDPGQHVAYVGHWLKMLRDDPKEILRACSDATRIQDHVLLYDLQHDHEREHEVEQKHDVAHERAAEPVAAMAIPAPPKQSGIATTAATSDKERVKYGVIDGAYIVEHRGIRIETWGDEHPVLAIRGAGRDGNGGCSLRFDVRDDAWLAICEAVAGRGRVEARLSGFLRDDNEVERHAEMLVVIGRSQSTGRVLVSMLPLAEPDRIMQVRMTRETAEQFAGAMMTADHRARKALVFDAVRGALEMAHVRAR